jgi:hypothetical protein
MIFIQLKLYWISFLFFIFFFSLTTVSAQVDMVSIAGDEKGFKLQIKGEDFFIIGMNWDYFPIGENYSYSLWNQPEEIIKEALDREMALLKNMHVNVIRQYVGIQPKWIEYIYKNYGIYTIINHSFGRYGVTIDGVYVQHTDYADPQTREQLLKEVNDLVYEYKDVPGLLMWLLGNENNYGLFWGGAATEDIPQGETLESVRARHMYNLFNEGIKEIKKFDTNHPVAICNGDLLFIDIISEEVTEMDVFGVNAYRGISFTDAFEKVKEKLDVPIMFTEFGSDAFNAVEMREDQLMQTKYLLGNWEEIYENAYGKGGTGISIGGMTFQFSDGWWKYLQDSNLDDQDIHASWSNGGYSEDYVEGENNMNEEWFGICAKGPTDERGLYQLYPRAAYYALQDAFTINPLDENINAQAIRVHFEKLSPMPYVLEARGDKAALETSELSAVRISGLRLEFETYNTGGYLITTPDNPPSDGITGYPAFLGFDHMESFYVDFESQPAANINAKLSLNVLGNVPINPIDEIFYENRGRPYTVKTPYGQETIYGNERVQVYSASINWEQKWFELYGFYRTGHYHWGYEGDFFGFYPEANYGPNLDIYNGNAPLGFEIAGKKQLEGLKIAFGPELWWGANPSILIKYSRDLSKSFNISGIYQEDLGEQLQTESSFAIPVPPTRKASLQVGGEYGIFGFEVGGIWSGSTKEGETYQVAMGEEGNYTILQGQIKSSDTFGGKAKVKVSSGRWNWYAEGSAQGLVADGGLIDQTLTFTGWRLRNTGRGNHYAFLTGLTGLFGNFQIAPNFLWQKPIEGPIPSDVPPPGRPRNVLDDPFAVLENREMAAAELLITYDPTPTTWMYDWDNDEREDARFAFSAGFVFKHQPTTKDASIGITAETITTDRITFPFPGATPPRDLWNFYARIISKFSPEYGLIANIYGGEAEPNGSNQRLIHPYGGDVRLILNSYKIILGAKFNDWGPYDYHRDFNLTYPVQLIADLSVRFGLPEWWDLTQTSLGVRGTWRSLDQYSPRYCPTMRMTEIGPICDPTAPGYPNGNEWEIRTYLNFNFGM